MAGRRNPITETMPQMLAPTRSELELIRTTSGLLPCRLRPSRVLPQTWWMASFARRGRLVVQAEGCDPGANGAAVVFWGRSHHHLQHDTHRTAVEF